MKGKVVVFAPAGRGADDALQRTRWMADRTLEVLAEREQDTVPVLDERATRTGLESAVTDDVTGLALFSHGRLGCFGLDMQDDAIMGAGGAVLDRDNLHLMKGRWGHAVACHAGTELAAQACAQGAECFVGYEGTLKVEWVPDAIPEGVRPLFTDLVTRTTRNLAAGVRDERALRAEVNRIAEDIAAWCLDHPDEDYGIFLEVTAQQLVDRLVYRAAQSRV
jgi:hypothetical protein